MTAIIFFLKVLPAKLFLRRSAVSPQKVKKMLTCWPMAAAPVAITKAASTRSRSPEKTTMVTRSSGCRASSSATRRSSAATRSPSIGRAADSVEMRGCVLMSSPSQRALEVVHVDVLAVLALGRLRDQLHVAGRLGPSLEVLHRSAVGREHPEGAPYRQGAQRGPRLHQGHGALEPAGIQRLIELHVTHQGFSLPKPEAISRAARRQAADILPDFQLEGLLVAGLGQSGVHALDLYVLRRNVQRVLHQLPHEPVAVGGHAAQLRVLAAQAPE